MALFTNKVFVQFVHSETGDTIAAETMDANQLPEAFQRDAFVRVGGEDWTIEEAIPPTAAEFRSTRQLQVRLRPVIASSEDSVLYSVPSVCDRQPPWDVSASAGDDPLAMPEEEWRQTELVTLAELDAVREDLVQIRRVLEQSASSEGFSKIHVRTAVPEPIPEGRLTLQDLRAAFDGATLHSSLLIEPGERVVPQGYALSLPGALSVYGVQTEGDLTELCVLSSTLARATPDAIGALARVALERELCLVRWCEARIERATAAGFEPLADASE